jgi:hypothetical protein
MSEERYNDNSGEIRESDLSNSLDGVLDEENYRENIDKQKLYKTEQKNIEKGIEKSGEKIRQSSSVGSRKGDNGGYDQNNDSVDYHAKEIIKLNADDQIRHLMKIATNKNPYLAIEVAKHLQDNYVLAELHSDLTEEKFRSILLEKGFL